MSQFESGIDTKALAARIEAIDERIERACAGCGRSVDEITLIAVSKTFSIAHVEAAHGLGHVDFGENRVQELIAKAEVLPPKAMGGSVVWHMIGHIQRNKAKAVIENSDLVHGVDSKRLARALDLRARELNKTIDCLIQVNTSGEESKFGLSYAEAEELADMHSDFSNLRFRGLMTIARPVTDPEAVRSEFRSLRMLRDTLSTNAPQMQYLSMGMSGDFEVAIEEGATHIRLGTAIFGPRSCSI